jgi:hypothetical protein
MEISKRTEKELQIIYMWHWYHNLFTKKEEIDPQRRKKQANKKVRFDPNCYHCEMCKYQTNNKEYLEMHNNSYEHKQRYKRLQTHWSSVHKQLTFM